MSQWIANLGFKGVQILSGEKHLINLQLAAESKTYCDELKGKTTEYGLEIIELSSHLQAQLIAVRSAYSEMYDDFTDASVRNNPNARTKWATQQLEDEQILSNPLTC